MVPKTGPVARRAGVGRHCEAPHMHPAFAALLMPAAGVTRPSRTREMSKRRVMVWWFRFVLSGRFLERFLSLPRR